MSKTPTARLEDIENLVERLGDNRTVHWTPGHCELPWATPATKDEGKRHCRGEGHPTQCDGAMEKGDFQEFPDRPTAKHVADAVDTLRADLSEALRDVLELVRGQQQQIAAVSNKHASHRHKVAEGHFSDRAET